ncbi:hypothetical protein JCM8097_007902 [Rhodosporidiobolus ruineniae]
MPRLPVEIWELILRYAANSLPAFGPHRRDSPPTRPRLAFLRQSSLVSPDLRQATLPVLLEAIAATGEKQLRLAAAFLETHPHLASYPSSLSISWTAGAGGSVKRQGAKKWRAATIRFIAACTKLGRFSIVGPARTDMEVQRLFDTGQDPYFDVSWIEGAENALTSLYISGLRLASFPEVSHISLPSLRQLDLVQYPVVDDPDLDSSVFLHFPALSTLRIVNTAGFRDLSDLLDTFLRLPPGSPHDTLERLTCSLPFFALAIDPHPTSPPPPPLPPRLHDLTLYLVQRNTLTGPAGFTGDLLPRLPESVRTLTLAVPDDEVEAHKVGVAAQAAAMLDPPKVEVVGIVEWAQKQPELRDFAWEVAKSESGLVGAFEVE